MKQKIKEEVRYDRKCDFPARWEIGWISGIAELEKPESFLEYWIIMTITYRFADISEAEAISKVIIDTLISTSSLYYKQVNLIFIIVIIECNR